MTDAVQYGRRISLIVAQSNGKGIELGALRVVFTVRRGDLQTPNALDARIYNLSAQTANLIAGKEFTRVALQVGYGPDDTTPLGLLFLGTIKQVRQGREDQKNSYVDITAADGDEFYNFAPVALSLAAGTTPDQELVSISQSAAALLTGQMATGALASEQNQENLVTLGYVPKLSSTGSVRGRVYFGLARDALRKFAEDNDCLWSIQDGRLTLIPQTSYIPGAPVIISPQTGLIGVPEQTENGLSMRVLMNTQIRIGRLVQLQDSAVNQYRYGLSLPSQKDNPMLARSTTKLNGQGLYYVMRADHTGDTRGEEWYSDLTCLAVDATVPPDSAPYAAILPSGAITRY